MRVCIRRQQRNNITARFTETNMGTFSHMRAYVCAYRYVHPGGAYVYAKVSVRTHDAL